MTPENRTERPGIHYGQTSEGDRTLSRFVMTVEDDLEGTSFEKLIPPKRRRVSYRVSENEMSFVVTTGLSEIYDILTHLTFLYIEAKHIYKKNEGRDRRSDQGMAAVRKRPSQGTRNERH